MCVCNNCKRWHFLKLTPQCFAFTTICVSGNSLWYSRNKYLELKLVGPPPQLNPTWASDYEQILSISLPNHSGLYSFKLLPASDHCVARYLLAISKESITVSASIHEQYEHEYICTQAWVHTDIDGLRKCIGEVTAAQNLRSYIPRDPTHTRTYARTHTHPHTHARCKHT